ncbi:DnaJ family domain-containing protein [Falsibacillus albus]|uniref:DUF1992 domain-containing protein n=1 Tax=Falsibacillus albus TaxID=2478915 RepID=A0A3L7JUS7_9BACI|nr:DnaJ family domain-containing protein [Falsibacillus albus]RLQ94476.1 DUF1992 domain-containing protein [Falsibacillus albus]
MDYFDIISEQRIREAHKNGEFDNLPGMGKPLPKDEFANVPQEIRMAYRLMKNAGYSPEESTLRQEMMTIESLIAQCDDEVEKEDLTKQLNEKMLKFNQFMSKRKKNTNSSLFKNYENKIEKKLL